MNIIFFIKVLLFALMVGLPVAIFAQGDKSLLQHPQDFDNLRAVDDTLLDKMRGGFVSTEGIKFDVGVGKAIYVDGILQTQNSFALNNIHFNGQAISAGNLQNISSDVKTIIQNNIDNKTIQNFTVLDVNVKNFGGFMESMRNIQDITSGQNIRVLR
jgi:hypothetical protein